MGARPWRVPAAIASLLLLVGCTAETGGARPGEGELADELAPSQRTSATAVPPDTPPPCDPDALELWTAQVAVDAAATGATIRVRNAGAVWCEVDISGSPGLDPAIEPTVWLDPGAWADLVVTPAADGCGVAELRRTVTVDVGGLELSVPTVLIGCDWRLSAFFPAEPPDGACTDLSVAVVEPFVVVRSDAGSSCELGAVVGDVTGEAGAVGVLALAPGDVVAVAYERSDADGSACTGTVAAPVEFDAAGTVTAEHVPCDAVIAAGPARPWFGDPAGPHAGLTAPPVGEDAARAALDPFAGGAR